MPEPELVLEPLVGEARDRWLAEVFAEYEQHRLESGDSEHEARAAAQAAREKRVPVGVPQPGQQVGRLVLGDEPVGRLWVGPDGDDPHRWWVSSIVVDPDRRGQGIGRRAMLLAERLAAEQGATSLGLSVFAGNRAARHLYRSLGLEETTVLMRKSL